jgi:hypothetical protein
MKEAKWKNFNKINSNSNKILIKFSIAIVHHPKTKLIGRKWDNNNHHHKNNINN